jgi:ATP-dependent RNA helicase DeaD
MTFKDLGLRTELVQAVGDLNYESPTQIQELAIPFVLQEEEDLIAYAQTGTGKTASFSLPILNDLEPNKDVQCIILSPTRELCNQITDDLKSYATKLNVRIAAVYGGASIDTQIKQLKRGCDIVVGTPGRTLDLVKRNKLNLNNVQWLVLDEADEMLSMGFAEDMDAILATTPDTKRTLLFSATMPKDMVRMAKKYMHNPKEISAGSKQEANTDVHHIYYRIKSRDRYAALKRAVDVNPDIYGIVFCRTRAETKEVAEKLAADGYNTDALHGDLSQAQRDYVMNRFRNRLLQILVATDVAARGLDVQDITHVINYKLPDEDAVYVHRSGRTGRAGSTGQSISLLTAKEESRLRPMEKKIGRRFERVEIPGGKEICEKQLFHLINNIIEIEISDKQIDRFLPQVYELFEGYTKEEIIRKVVSVEFNRFLSYYRNAPDLNKGAESKSGERASRRSDGGKEMTRYFMSLGKKDGLKPKDVLRLINELLGEHSPEIGQIEIMKMFSFFEMESGYTSELKKKVKNLKYRGNPVSIDESKPRKGGGGGSRGSSGARRRRRR